MVIRVLFQAQLIDYDVKDIKGKINLKKGYMFEKLCHTRNVNKWMSLFCFIII